MPSLKEKLDLQNKEVLVSNAIGDIVEDSDRVEKLIQENADSLQDKWLKAYDVIKHSRPADKDAASLMVLYALGKEIFELINYKIELLATEDVEQRLE